MGSQGESEPPGQNPGRRRLGVLGRESPGGRGPRPQRRLSHFQRSGRVSARLSRAPVQRPPPGGSYDAAAARGAAPAAAAACAGPGAPRAGPEPRRGLADPLRLPAAPAPRPGPAAEPGQAAGRGADDAALRGAARDRRPGVQTPRLKKLGPPPTPATLGAPADAATLAAMRRPRCSLPDVLGLAGLVRRRRRYALGGSAWKKRVLSWRVQSFPQGSALTPHVVRTLMHYALAVWAAETDLTFQEVQVQGPQEPDILIGFSRAFHEDSYPFDGPGGTLAHAFFPGEHSISGDTHFDDEETWTFGMKDGEGTDLFAVAVHEFGHALGLGHSSATDSIMRPFYQGPVGDPDKYRLSPDDRDGLQQLYGKAPQNPADRPTRKPLTAPPLPPTAFPDNPSSPFPDRCQGNFDAIANIRGETFFFKGPWFWRLQPSGQLVSPRPARLHRFWEGLPPDVRTVQAAYARHPDGRILLFSGPRFWVFRDRQFEGAARPLTELGLPAGEAVDAVFSWPQNGKTYLVRGSRYWRFDEAAGRPDPGYPRDLSLWEGAPHAPDDVTVSNEGDTYFVKGTHYWRFPKGSVKADPDSPQPLGPQWLDCPKPPQTTQQPGSCNCRCELNRASGRLVGCPLLPLLPLLLGGAAGR